MLFVICISIIHLHMDNNKGLW